MSKNGSENWKKQQIIYPPLSLLHMQARPKGKKTYMWLRYKVFYHTQLLVLADALEFVQPNFMKVKRPVPSPLLFA